MPVFRLSNKSNKFPPPELARDDGLLAIGGDLNTERLLNAYSNGIFPWYNPNEAIKWWCPNERFVIFPDNIHISNSMKKVIKNTNLEIKINTDFDCIIHNCRVMRDNHTWITDEMEVAYNKLFELGHALSVGVYEKNTLVGGLYGVVIGKCFFGESMFSKVDNASKLALIKLAEMLSRENFTFIDCQFHTCHLENMGGQYISWEMYRKLLRDCWV